MDHPTDQPRGPSPRPHNEYEDPHFHDDDETPEDSEPKAPRPSSPRPNRKVPPPRRRRWED